MPFYNEDAHEGPLMDHISFIFTSTLFFYLLKIFPCDFFSRSFAMKLGHIYLPFFHVCQKHNLFFLSIVIFLGINSYF